ncbi:MAG: helix-turn-helix domain-containing protein [Verrucomicrobia bacterium]|nr:helix-turn-helix domain-containing protein [Verrucomicrobiota bacterium]
MSRSSHRFTTLGPLREPPKVSLNSPKSGTLDLLPCFRLFRLITEFWSLEAIAESRGIVLSTVEGHVAQLIESGEEIDWRPMVPAETEALLRKLFDKHGSEVLAPVVTAANGAASYGQAKIVRAVLAAES